jgi:Zn-dependent protease with chaperone function
VTALELVVFAVVLVVATTAAITRTTWPYRAPCAALVFWAAGLAAAGSALVLAVVVLFADPHPYRGATAYFGIAGAIAVVAAGWLAVGIIRRFLAMICAARPRRQRHSDLLDLFATALPGHSDVAVLDHATPLAYCVPGLSTHRVVVSHGLLTTLAPPELDAVLAHERHHLTGRHYLITHLGDALAATLPRWRTAPHLVTRLAELVEMCADCAARRHVGNHATARALIALSDMPSLTDTLPASGRAVHVRVQHLLLDTRCCRSPRAVTVFGLAGITALAPLLGTAVVLVAELCMWVCV